MPRALLYECFSGMAGDMHLGAMLDLGVPETNLRSELSKLGLDSEFTLEARRGKKLGISGTQVAVELTATDAKSRSLPDINRIIDAAALSDGVKTRAKAMFASLGAAEAQVHEIPIDKVHFHEVGAVDAIVDIVGAAIVLEYLDPDIIYCNGVELGAGMVKCAHGLMPVPAPATALLLENCPTTRGHVDGEATTPTGATILAHAVDKWVDPTRFSVEKTAYGVGHKDFKRPNVLRVSLGETSSTLENEVNAYIECNVDDMSPEAYEPLSERLFELGAKDVFFTPIIMKKTRPGTKLSVLVSDQLKEKAIETILAHSTTIGVRAWDVEKSMLPRREDTIPTSLGSVRVKIVTVPDGSRRWKVEHDDIRKLARTHDRSYLEIRNQIDREVSDLIELHDGD